MKNIQLYTDLDTKAFESLLKPTAGPSTFVATDHFGSVLELAAARKDVAMRQLKTDLNLRRYEKKVLKRILALYDELSGALRVQDMEKLDRAIGEFSESRAYTRLTSKPWQVRRMDKLLRCLRLAFLKVGQPLTAKSP